MKFFIDENIAPQIGRALMILQQPLNYEEDVKVYNIREVYGQGSIDEEWIPDIGNQDGIIIRLLASRGLLIPDRERARHYLSYS